MEIQKEMYHSDPACSVSDDTFHQLTHRSLTHRTAHGSKHVIIAPKLWSLPATGSASQSVNFSGGDEDHMTETLTTSNILRVNFKGRDHTEDTV
jgi:hypothetical protein